MEYTINKDLTEQAKQEIGLTTSRYFISAAYDFIRAGEESFVNFNGDTVTEPKAHGVIAVFDDKNKANDYFESTFLADGLSDAEYPTEVTLEGPEGMIDERFIARSFCYSENRY